MFLFLQQQHTNSFSTQKNLFNIYKNEFKKKIYFMFTFFILLCRTHIPFILWQMFLDFLFIGSLNKTKCFDWLSIICTQLIGFSKHNQLFDWLNDFVLNNQRLIFLSLQQKQNNIFYDVMNSHKWP